MLQLKLDHSGVDATQTIAKLQGYTDHLRSVRGSSDYNQPESSLRLPGDQKMFDQVQKLVSKLAGPDLKYHVVVGIGGSNLGTKAVYDALLGYADILEPDRFPKLLFAETTDPEWLTSFTRLASRINKPAEILITVISKSGGTTETLANFEIIARSLEQKLGEVTGRIVVITDNGSSLMQAAETKHLACLAIPDPVGGRYSVLSPVGLFPLLTAGLDVGRLREGAQAMLDRSLDQDNLPAASAAVLSLQQAKGLHINDNFFFHPELESLGKWYRQLMGESVGKEHTKSGDIVHAGLTPTVSLGSTDLHSVGQLYLGGPKDKLTTFIFADQSEPIAVPSNRFFGSLVPMVTGQQASHIMAAILEGTKIAYVKADRPYIEVILGAVEEYSLGEYLQYKMLEMMYLGQLLNVNAFDQPNVEAYKLETRRLLEKPSA